MLEIFNENYLKHASNMKRLSILFIQGLILIIGALVLVFLIWFPQLEGRAKHLDLLRIYADPFILYVYASSVLFFIALFNSFKWFGFIRKNETYTIRSLHSLQTIKYSAVALAVCVVGAGIFIAIFHHQDDDPAGFLTISFLFTFFTLMVARAAHISGNVVRSAISQHPENIQSGSR